MNPKDWQRAVKAREASRKYMKASGKLGNIQAPEAELEQVVRARAAVREHSQVFHGIAHFGPDVVHTWRVLWYSMPSP